MPLIKSIYNWWRHALWLLKMLGQNYGKAFYFFLGLDAERAGYWFREGTESWWWLKIHITYKSKRIK